MQPDRAQLAERFRDMSDEELLATLRKDLTELAGEVARQEAQRRGLGIETPAAVDADADPAVLLENAPGPEAAYGPLKLCARYLNPLDAQVLATCLQSEGLAAVVMDVNTIYGVGALFGSLPRGGARVMVPESQLETALKIRAAYDAGEMAIDEDYDVGKE